MSARAFDPDTLMRGVRAAANVIVPATTATLLRNEAKRSRVADVAALSASKLDETALADAIEERAGLVAGSVPTVYLDAWARLNHQQPFDVSEVEWRRALDDGGRLLDAWGSEAAEMGWTPGELFDVTAGLVWRLTGERVEALGPDHARLGDGRTIEKNRRGAR